MCHLKQTLILASRSPRRAELLRAVGYSFKVRAPRITEEIQPDETPWRAARRLAVEKAIDVARRVRAGRVLGADTLVVVDGAILGKPTGVTDARRMLRMLSGRPHRVVTGLALADAGARHVTSTHAITTVVFRQLSSREIDWYLSTGDPMDKAGAYGIQGGAGLFVTRISGSASNVVGLPLDLVGRLLGLPG